MYDVCRKMPGKNECAQPLCFVSAWSLVNITEKLTADGSALSSQVESNTKKGCILIIQILLAF